MSYAQAFGDLLRSHRQAAGLTQEELAERAALSARAIGDLERGAKLRPHRDTVRLLVAALNLSGQEQAEFELAARAARTGSRATQSLQATPSGTAPMTPPISTPHGNGNIPPSSALRHSAPLHNLPSATTSFIGRQHELEQVGELLRRSTTRLVTLTGAGGSGKTRLALEAARTMLDEFADGVYFVDLSPLIDPDLVLSQISWTLGIVEALDRPLIATMQRYLRDKQVLLVLDNFEHLLQAAPLVTELLVSAGQLKVLATSRVRLHLRGEHELAVPPLALPDVSGLPNVSDERDAGQRSDARNASGWAAWEGNEAVRLFVERAAQVQVGFGLTEQNARAVVEIVRRLDGLPLAIELAAARVRLLPPQAMLSRLENRLKLLVGGARDAAERQQTLRGTIDWSYQLLQEGEKQLFRRMAVFQGGRTLEGLETVCNYDGTVKIDMLEGVEGLVAGSLLQLREGSNGEPRFWMLETIHEYAREKLEESGEASVLRREHAIYFTRLAEEAESSVLGGSAQMQWLNRLEDEHENVRAALLWASERAQGPADGGVATEGEAEGEREAGRVEAGELGLRLAGALWGFWWASALLKEGTDCLERALSLPDSILQACSVSSRIKALSAAGLLANRHHDYVSAGSYLEQVLALAREAGDRSSIADCLRELGELARLQADYSRARAFLEESIVLYEELGNKWGRGMALNLLGLTAREEGNYTAALSLFEDALGVLGELGNKLSMGISLGGMAAVFYLQGNYSASLAYEEEALALFSEPPQKLGIGWCLYIKGLVAQAQGDYPAARAHFSQSLAICGEVEDSKAAASRLAQLGSNCSDNGASRDGCQALRSSARRVRVSAICWTWARM